MGTCNLFEAKPQHKHELTYQQQFLGDHHHLSSVLIAKNNHQLFQKAKIKNFIDSKFEKNQIQNHNTQSQASEIAKTHKKLPPAENRNSIFAQILQQKTLNLNQKENTLFKQKSVRQRRSSRVNITGDFLKIKQKIACSEYRVLAKIANKKIGQLYKVLDKTTKQIRSLQIINSSEANGSTLNEIQILKKLDHPSIYHLYDIFLKKGFYYLVGQYIEGDNLYCLVNDDTISEKKLAKVIKQVLRALNYLHYRGIMHRNIKPETIVFQSRVVKDTENFPSIKLINFKKASEIKLIKEHVGHQNFMAPQVFTDSHNQKCDIWSIGVILYLLASGQLPFTGHSKEQLQHNIVYKDLNFNLSKWKDKSQSLKQLLRQMLHKSPNQRISASEALKSSWFEEQLISQKIIVSQSQMNNLFFIRNDSKFKTIIKTYIVKMTTSLQQRQDIAKKFISIDKDCNGLIDKNQLIAACKEIKCENLLQQANIDRIISKIDINKSGMIDFSQFMAGVLEDQTLFSRQRLSKAFEFIDRDATGQIQVSELIQLLKNEIKNENQRQEDGQITQILKDFDHDGDKTISKQQFIHFFLKIKKSQLSTFQFNKESN